MSQPFAPKRFFAVLLIPFLLSGCAHLDLSGFSEDALSRLLDSGHIFYAVLLSFGAGFLTSLSPCVYPLIPITLSVIGARRYESLLQGFSVSLVYVAGMIVLYVGLGILFASLGILFGGVFQSPWVLIIVALSFFFFALSLVGASGWLLPDRLLQKLARVGGSGYKGAFLMGLVSGLIASPCTGPVLAFILTLISKNGDLKTGSMLMLFFGFGIGTPFLILGTFSSLLSHIPKSGRWMSIVKWVLAFLMFVPGLYYLHLGISGLSSSQNQTKDKGTWLTIGKTGDALAILENALAEAQKKQLPVLIDFYADWCVACHELDEKTFQNPNVATILNDFKLIRIDLSTLSDSLNKIQDKYNVVGLPLVVFYDNLGNLFPRKVFGYLEPEEFLPIIYQIKK